MTPHRVDVLVGKRIRHRRRHVGLTQQQLAKEIGVKFQQLQKYETAKNRVSASRLWDIAEALHVSPNFFFSGAEEFLGKELVDTDLPLDILEDKEALDLVRNYYAIPEKQRRRFLALAKSISDGT